MDANDRQLVLDDGTWNKIFFQFFSSIHITHIIYLYGVYILVHIICGVHIFILRWDYLFLFNGEGDK